VDTLKLIGEVLNLVGFFDFFRHGIKAKFLYHLSGRPEKPAKNGINLAFGVFLKEDVGDVVVPEHQFSAHQFDRDTSRPKDTQRADIGKHLPLEVRPPDGRVDRLGSLACPACDGHITEESFLSGLEVKPLDTHGHQVGKDSRGHA